MKTESLTFLCDVSKCDERVTVSLYDGETGAYLQLVEKGWKVKRGFGKWRHVCTKHEIGDLK